MADLFTSVDKADHYILRLRAYVDGTGFKTTEADKKAVLCLVEERNLLYELLRTVRRMRREQKDRERAIRIGVTGRSGLDEVTARAHKLEGEIDAKLLEFIGPEEKGKP